MSYNASRLLTITVREPTPGSLVLSERRKTGPPTLAVIEALSEINDMDPTQIKPPLNNVIDPDALDGLFQRNNHHQASQPEIEVSFSYTGYHVTITGNFEGHSTSPESSSAHQ